MLARSVSDTVGDKVGQRYLIAMLQFAATTFAEVLTNRLDKMRAALNDASCRHEVSGRSTSDMKARRGDAITLGSDADYLFSIVHKKSS